MRGFWADGGGQPRAPSAATNEPIIIACLSILAISVLHMRNKRASYPSRPSAGWQGAIEQEPGLIGGNAARSKQHTMLIMEPRAREQLRDRRRAFPQCGCRREQSKAPDRGARSGFGILAAQGGVNE